MSQVSIISTGVLEDDFQEFQVINNIVDAFKFTPETAKKMVKKETIIKKSVSLEFANKLADRLLSHGLKVIIKQLEEEKTPKNKQSRSEFFEQKSEIEKLITAPFPQKKLSSQYKRSLLLALTVSLIAPIIYIAIIVLLFHAGFQYYALLTGTLLENSNPLIALIAIIVPYFTLSVIILFLLKPLFASYEKSKHFELHRKDAPALFNLIDVMCENMSVPFPAQICVDTEINASAGALNGFSSLNKGQLRLTIGLPLLLNLNIRELSFIVAHELGHFAQSTAMRVYYFVHTINSWFASRAYQKDEWDERLKEWSEKADWHIAGTLSIVCAQQSIKLTRIIFSQLYKLNYRLTQYMSRAMEYDADSYATRFVGSEQLQKTFVKMQKLVVASAEVEQINIEAWNGEYLLADLPLAIVALSIKNDKKDKNKTEQIIQQMMSSKTASMDSHPADSDRIKQSLEDNNQGIFNAEFPAKSFVKSMTKLCELATIETYKNEGLHHPQNHVVANNRLIDQDEQKQQAKTNFNTFFNEIYQHRFLNLSAVSADKPHSHIACMNAIRGAQPDYQSSALQYQKLKQDISNLELFKAYSNAGIEVDSADFYLQIDNINEIGKQADDLNYQLVEEKNNMKVMDQLFYERINFNKQLLQDKQQETLSYLLKNLQMMQRLEPLMMRLHNYITIFHHLLSVDEELHKKVLPLINRYAEMCFSGSRQLLNEAKNIELNENKFTHLDKFIESWSGPLPTQKQSYQLDEHFETAEQICKAIHYQYYWHFAEIATLCCHAERSHKINSLSFPIQVI